jgi:hypothetical protein
VLPYRQYDPGVGNVKRTVFLAACVAALAVTLVASAAPVVNGDFETGDLTGWTTFTTANGTIGTPAVVSFDTTGTGASNAAKFNVGRQVLGSGAPEGGGIHQSVNTAAGEFDVSADVAVRLEAAAEIDASSCGSFELLVDGAVVAGHDFGNCDGGVTERSTLSAAGQSPTPVCTRSGSGSPGRLATLRNFSTTWTTSA